MFFYNLKWNRPALPLLEKAARAGDADSQYFIGEIERKSATYVTDESQHWYELAASQGHVYAMMRLFNVKLSVCRLLDNCSGLSKEGDVWRAYAKRVAEQQAAQGNGKAMFQLFLMTSKFDWLVRSAKARFPEGQHWLAIQYLQGRGFFIIPGSRQREVEELLFSAAEAGFGPAMEKLEEIFRQRGDKACAVMWTERAAKAGSLKSMIRYAARMANTSEYHRYPLDLVKAYGVALVLSNAGLPSRVVSDRINLKKLTKLMSEEQVEEGKVFASEWERIYSPLSLFPVEYGL